MVWSNSRIASFKHCKYGWYLNYIVKDDELYPSESNFYAENGSLMHKILEMVFKGELPLEDAALYYVDHFDEEVTCKAKPATMEKTFEACATYLSEGDFEWLKDYEILGVELEMNFKIAGYEFIAFIDLLLRDKRDGKIVVMDHKSSEYPFKVNGKSVKKNKEQTFLEYKRQMYLYSSAIKDKYGEFPKEIIWNHFKEDRFARIPFSKKEYGESVNWFINTIHEIEKEEDFEAKLDYFFCKTLCSFRSSCEYCAAADWKHL